MKVTQSSLFGRDDTVYTVYTDYTDYIDYTVHEFFRPEYWSGQPFPSPGDLPNPGIEPRSLASQADSLPAEPLGKRKSPQENA